MGKEKLNIISQNFNGYSKRQEKRLLNIESVTNYLKKYEADIIAGQEFPASINEKNLNGSFDGQAKKRSHFFTGFYVNNNNYKGNLIPNDKIETIWNKVDKYSCIIPTFRSAYWCEKQIKFCGKSIRIINVHISPTYEMILKLSLIEYIKKLRNKYIILLGDFNASEKKDTEKYIKNNDRFLKLIRDIGFEELKKEKEYEKGHYTHYEKTKGRKLDHIFVSKEFYDKFDYDIEYIDEVNKTHPDYINNQCAFTDHSGIKVSFKKKIKRN